MSKECGMSATEMGQRFMNDMTYVFDHWNPRNRLNLYRARSKKEKIKTGLYNPIKDR
jgi:hypothetical protein